MFLGIDPGKNIGLAWVNEGGELLDSAIVTLEQLASLSLADTSIILGDGTGLAKLIKLLDERQLSYQVIDETGTSLEARQLYFKDHPARGWQRLLPYGLRSPPRPIDDYAAYAIVLKYLASSARP